MREGSTHRSWRAGATPSEGAGEQRRRTLPYPNGDEERFPTQGGKPGVVHVLQILRTRASSRSMALQMFSLELA